MAENSSNPYQYPPWEETGLPNSIVTDLQNLRLGRGSNLNPSSTALSIQALETPLRHLRLSLSSMMAATVNFSDHSWPPELTSNSNIIDETLDLQRLLTVAPPSASVPGQTGHRAPFQEEVLPFSRRNQSASTASSSSCSSNNGGHGRSFFHHRTEYPPAGAPNWESSRIRSPAVGIGTDYVRLGPRNGGGYRHGRGLVESVRREEDDYEALRRVIEGGDLMETQKIIDATKDHLHELMFNRFGNGFVQILFECCDEVFITTLLLSLIRRENLFVAVCVHNLGHRALVKLLDRLRRPNQQSLVAIVIGRHGITLAKSFSGGHEVLKRCFQKFSRENNEMILLRITHSCLDLARDQAGCCILQSCIEYANGNAREALVAPLIQDADYLSRHAYGNYVIQFMIQLDGARIGARIIRELRNKFVGLSLDKFGSNVVEKCLSYGEGEAAAAEIIFEIMENEETWLQVFTDEYGNYVAQKAISIAKGEAYSLLVRAITRHWIVLQYHPYGRNVIATIKRVQKKSKSLRF